MAFTFMNLPAVQAPRSALLDFAPLSNAIDTYRQGAQQKALVDQNRAIGQTAASQGADAASRQAYGLGRIEEGAALGKQGEAQKDRFVKRYGQLAQQIDLEQDPQRRATMWQGTLERMRREGAQLGIAGEYDPEELDPGTGPKLFMAQAGLISDPLQREKAQAELDLTRAQIEKTSRPDQPSLPTGYRWKPDGTGMEAIPGGPATQPPKKSVTELKQIHAADDAVPVLDQTVETLKKAEALISKEAEAKGSAAYEGTGAGWAGYIGSRVPGGSYVFDETRSKSTDEWGTIMNMEAIKSMAENLKGATTNFELQEFVRILADPSQPREIRRRTLQRMRSLAEKQSNLARRRAEEIRSGEYYRPEAGGAGATGVLDLGDGFSVEVE